MSLFAIHLNKVTLEGRQLSVPAEVHLQWENLSLAKMLKLSAAQFDILNDGELVITKVGLAVANLAGQLQLPKVLIQSKEDVVRNEVPVRISFDNGEMKMERVKFIGEGGNIETEADIDFSSKVIRTLSLNGDFSFSMLAPFLKNMSLTGSMKIEASVLGPLASPELKGNALLKVDDFVFKAMVFLHPILRSNHYLTRMI